MSDRTRAIFNGAFLIAAALVAIDESLSKLPATTGALRQAPHTRLASYSDLSPGQEPMPPVRVALHLSRAALIKYLNDVAELYQQ